MMAKAIGPQNTVGAIGIRPRTVEIAVSMIGRKRAVAGAITASYTPLPSARSVSICTIRMTAFLAIMPISARMPRMATKPSGRLNSSSASTTPIRPSGTMLSTMASRRKLSSWNISTISISTIISGTTANTERLRVRALLDRPPVSTLYGLGQLGGELGDLGCRARQPPCPAARRA